MTDKQIIIKRIRDCDNCRFRPETSKVCEIYDNCYLVSEHIANLREQLKAKEQECEELKEGYSELTDIVSPYMDDFTGYNEELGGFDIVLCIKELMEQLDRLKAENKGFKILHESDKGLITATGKMNYQLIQEYDKLKTALNEIKEIAKKGHKEKGNLMRTWWFKDILQKISECEGNDG